MEKEEKEKEQRLVDYEKERKIKSEKIYEEMQRKQDSIFNKIIKKIRGKKK